MVRTLSIDKNGLKKAAWSKEDDETLRFHIQGYGHWNWRQLPNFASLSRCGKNCRLRWMNYLRYGVRRGNYTVEEENLILKLHKEYGNRWSTIAADNEIKNYWHTYLRKRMKRDIKPKNMDNSDQKKQASSTSTFDSKISKLVEYPLSAVIPHFSVV